MRVEGIDVLRLEHRVVPATHKEARCGRRNDASVIIARAAGLGQRPARGCFGECLAIGNVRSGARVQRARVLTARLVSEHPGVVLSPPRGVDTKVGQCG
eukprot:7051034-Prymnesium_polylepis.1